MKYNDNGTYKDIYVKTFDTLPVGTEVDYDGERVPRGYVQVSEKAYKSKNAHSSSDQTISGTTAGTIISDTITTTGKPLFISMSFVATTSTQSGRIRFLIDNTPIERLGTLLQQDGRMCYSYTRIQDNLSAGEHTITIDVIGESASFSAIIPAWSYQSLTLIEL